MDSGATEQPGMMNGFKFGDLYTIQSTVDSSQVLEPYLDPNNYVNLPYSLPDPGYSSNDSFAPSPGDSLVDHSMELSEIHSDLVLSYISKMLMEEDMEEKIYTEQGDPALQAAEKPFYDLLSKTEKSTSSPDQPPLYSDSWESPDDSGSGQFSNSNYGNGSGGAADNSWYYDLAEHPSSHMAAISADYSPESFFSSSNSASNTLDGPEDQQFSTGRVPDLSFESQLAWQFNRGVEEASKFLPDGNKLVIDLEPNGLQLPLRPKIEEGKPVEVKQEEEREHSDGSGSRGRKNPYHDDLDAEEGRITKQSAVFTEQTVRTKMFDEVLLCNGDKCSNAVVYLRESLQNEVSKNAKNGKGSSGAKSRGKKQVKKEVVDLRTLLVHCAQSVATDDRRTANELLKQIRQHSSLTGDGSQRLAHCFANGLEARLAGTGSQIYHCVVPKRPSAADILKAYQLYMAACPFKKISYFFANQTILNLSEKVSRIHIVDFGIGFGFQWPCFLQRLGMRAGGAPRIRITGIDEPQPGFRPTERIEETGRRLADYAESFSVPFEFHPIASKWENVKVEDVKIEKDEVLVVQCLYQLKNLADETVVVDSPRDIVLGNIRKLNPDVFIQGIVNGAYSAPFFVTRFREALFYFSALFDMLDSTVPREHPERVCLESKVIGREVLNVISCEGSERVSRPETFKQWQVRYRRAGFTQLPLDPNIMKNSRQKVRSAYNKEFVVDEDNKWLLLGWKGRITHALSSWK